MKNHEGLIVSLEGISGSGKTYFATKLRDALRDFTVDFVTELSDRLGNGIDDRIVAALNHTGDRFFRMGYPHTETFLLLALKNFDYEAAIKPSLRSGSIVIEDRGIDTIAIYQSIILAGADTHTWLETANQIYALAAMWRRPPDLTFLIDDDFNTAIQRAEQRSGRSYAKNELALLRAAARLYLEYAARHQDRIVLLDRRKLSENEILEMIRERILAKQPCP